MMQCVKNARACSLLLAVQQLGCNSLIRPTDQPHNGAAVQQKRCTASPSEHSQVELHSAVYIFSRLAFRMLVYITLHFALF